MARPLRQLPWLFTFAFDSLTSIRRLEEFLSLSVSPIRTDQGDGVLEDSTGNQIGLAPHSIDIRGLNLKIGEASLLKNIRLQVRTGEFVAIVGEVGAGKTLLLLSLMEETSATFDKFDLNGNDAQKMSPAKWRSHFSYVSQESFVISATLRENVALKYGTAKTQDSEITGALEAAQFDVKQENISSGLETEIGERGVNLSGGQKQRVNLARADYFDRSVILLDDCLSAVDVDTERRVLEELVLGAWKNKTRILVTHRLSALPLTDRILFMKAGEIIAEGTFASLLESSQEFRQHTMSVATEIDV